jgi:hypothetical protein
MWLDRIWLAIAMVITFAMVLFGGCATTSTPYLRTQPVFEPTCPPGPGISACLFADGPPLVITVVNPLPHAIEAFVVCESGNTWQWDHGALHVPAHGEVRVLGQVMARDVHRDVCEIKHWELVAAPFLCAVGPCKW